LGEVQQALEGIVFGENPLSVQDGLILRSGLHRVARGGVGVACPRHLLRLLRVGKNQERLPGPLDRAQDSRAGVASLDPIEGQLDGELVVAYRVLALQLRPIDAEPVRPVGCAHVHAYIRREVRSVNSSAENLRITPHLTPARRFDTDSFASYVPGRHPRRTLYSRAVAGRPRFFLLEELMGGPPERRTWVPLLAGVVWLAGVGRGMGVGWAYAGAPGRQGLPPGACPAGSRVQRAPRRATPVRLVPPPRRRSRSRVARA